MQPLTFKHFNQIFDVVCILTTIGLVSWCLYAYNLNEDTSMVDFKMYHTSEVDLYPSLTLCLSDPFDNDKLKEIGEGINSSSYADFLNGRHWDERMIDIDYDNVSLDIENFIRRTGPIETTKYWYQWLPNDPDIENKPRFYVSRRYPNIKCFTIDVPFFLNDPITRFSIKLNSSFFRNGIRPQLDKFEVLMHYPHQSFMAACSKKRWATMENHIPEYYELKFLIENIDVLKLRNKPTRKCHEDWKQHDDKILDKVMSIVGCRPPHWKTGIKIPRCAQMQEHKDLYNWIRFDRFADREKFGRPCRSIEKIFLDIFKYNVIFK